MENVLASVIQANAQMAEQLRRTPSPGHSPPPPQMINHMVGNMRPQMGDNVRYQIDDQMRHHNITNNMRPQTNNRMNSQMGDNMNSQMNSTVSSQMNSIHNALQGGGNQIGSQCVTQSQLSDVHSHQSDRQYQINGLTTSNLQSNMMSQSQLQFTAPRRRLSPPPRRVTPPPNISNIRVAPEMSQSTVVGSPTDLSTAGLSGRSAAVSVDSRFSIQSIGSSLFSSGTRSPLEAFETQFSPTKSLFDTFPSVVSQPGADTSGHLPNTETRNQLRISVDSDDLRTSEDRGRQRLSDDHPSTAGGSAERQEFSTSRRQKIAPIGRPLPGRLPTSGDETLERAMNALEIGSTTNILDDIGW